MSKFSERGFSLVELSISLIIIAAIFMGVIGGKVLTKEAELRKMISQNSQIRTGYLTFYNTFGAIPGDFKNGFSYWGSGTCTNVSVHSNTAGCNGDGGGNLNGSSSNEWLLLWRHLSFANLIPGDFSVWTSGTKILGTHVPQGVRANSGYYSAYDSYYGIVPTQDMFIFGASVSGNDPYGAVLAAPEAYSIDQKVDDGHPIQGRVISGTSPSGATGTCINGSGFENLTGATAYTLSNGAISCRVILLYN